MEQKNSKKKLSIAEAYMKCPMCGEMMCPVSEIETEQKAKPNGVVVWLITYPCCGKTKREEILPKVRKKERRGTKIRFRWTGTHSREQFLNLADHRTRILEKQGDKVTWEKKAVRKYDEVFNTIEEGKKIDEEFFEEYSSADSCKIVPLYSYSYKKVHPEETDKNLWHKHHNFGIHKVKRNHRNRGRHQEREKLDTGTV